MKITVINGSPKGKNSITLHTLLYLQKKFTDHEFEFIPAAAGIRAFEKSIDKIRPGLENADLIVFSYPVYTFMAPSQLHRFIEILKEKSEAGELDLKGKFVTQISTSKHFYDITAHSFIEQNCIDLGMRYIKGLSADMEDLTKPKGRQQAIKFMKYVIWEMEGKRPEAVLPEENRKPVVIVADLRKEDTRLEKMIESFREKLQWPSKVVNIREFDFKGGCLGCLKCAATGKCVYNDGFEDFLRNTIQSGAAIMYAFTIKDHSMGAYFKMFDDRQFCNGHRTVTMGTPVGYTICGKYSREDNLRLMLEARAQAGGNFFAGAAADEEGELSYDEIEKSLNDVALKMDYALVNDYAPPSNFLGVGGTKIFRDLIYMMRGFMKADHKFFKEKGLYDFPQKQKGSTFLMYLVGALMSSEKAQKKMGTKMTQGMIAPYKKAIEED